MTAVQMVVIQGEQYALPAPYAEGHVLTAAEAAAMNTALANTIRNILSARIRKRKESNLPPLSAEEIEDFARNFKFELRSRRNGEHDEVTKEARRLAKLSIVAALKKSGRSLKSVADTDEAREAWLEDMIDSVLEQKPSLYDTARTLVESRKAARQAVTELAEDQPPVSDAA